MGVGLQVGFVVFWLEEGFGGGGDWFGIEVVGKAGEEGAVVPVIGGGSGDVGGVDVFGMELLGEEGIGVPVVVGVNGIGDEVGMGTLESGSVV